MFDPASGELLQNGIRIRLSKQTADIVLALLVNAGSLVTRQQIRDLLWPGGEQVDHEKIINNGIGRLRYIFKDDPRSQLSSNAFQNAATASFPVSPLELAESHDEAVSLSQSIAPQALDLQAEDAQRNVPTSVLVRPSYLGARFGLAAVPNEIPNEGRAQGKYVPVIRIGLVLLLLFAAGLSWALVRWHRERQTMVRTGPEEISLAVAPLDASGDDARQLAESFRLDLTDSLAQLPHVQVRAAHSVNQLHLTDASYPTYSSKLGLDFLLFGQFSVVGRVCQLQFELVRGKDATHSHLSLQRHRRSTRLHPR